LIEDQVRSKAPGKGKQAGRKAFFRVPRVQNLKTTRKNSMDKAAR
jgi:hypothetical protein